LDSRIQSSASQSRKGRNPGTRFMKGNDTSDGVTQQSEKWKGPTSLLCGAGGRKKDQCT